MDFSRFHPYVYYATRYPFAKGQSSRPRICYASSLYLISEGNGTLRTCGNTYEATPGSLVYIPAGQAHEWIADERNPMVHVCCYFDWLHTDRTAEFKTASAICYDFAQLKPSLIGTAFPYPLPVHTKADSIRVWCEWFEKFYTANEYTNERSFLRDLRTQAHFQLFIEHYLAHSLSGEKIADPRINKVLDQMEQDLVRGDLKPLENYYSSLRLSRGYFFQLFKSATGLSPVQYCNQFRISRAKDDLRFSELTITEIAEKHHFSSVHYFSRLFLQVTSQSPREYRKNGVM